MWIRNASAQVLFCFCLMVFISEYGTTQEPNGSETGNQKASVDRLGKWKTVTAERYGTTLQDRAPIGGRFDLMGNGALLLEKKASKKPFYATRTFRGDGSWTSRWHTYDRPVTLSSLRMQYWVYGQKQDMGSGWTKFTGNPLICKANWKHATDESLQLPDPSLNPNDQSLVRGAGKWSGKWLLFFNIGSWAKKGWGVAVADSLHPLQKGRNPFQVGSPYPLVTGAEHRNASSYSKHAPNDFIHVESDGAWYAPDETGGGPSHMWTASKDGVDWRLQGPIEGISGHDPGMAFDGNRYHLFNENSPYIVHMVGDDPFGKWTVTGNVLEVGGHTGDADVSFFNNRWHMFFDDDPHGHYKLGYAWTTPEEFPNGWRMTHHVYGPHNPEQNQTWDNDTDQGNQFGTGDADVALAGKTLYLTHERPIGLAYKKFALQDGSEQTVSVKLEVDRDGDKQSDYKTNWLTVEPGTTTLELPSELQNISLKHVRAHLRLQTTNPVESPMIRSITLKEKSGK